MTLRHMKIFCAICEHNFNTTKAAEALHMTQPAVSLAVKELEQYYGVVLFDRIGRRLQITQTGEKFLQYAIHISSLFENMERELKNGDSHGLLRVGASITIGSQFLPHYINTFNSQYPETEVRAIVTTSDQLEKMVLHNELDFALIEGLSHCPSIVSEAYMEDWLSIIAAAKKGFLPDQLLSKELFCQQSFLLREPGSGTREVFDRAAASAGFSVTPLWESISTTALVNAVIQGLGISVLPYRMIQEPLKQGHIITLRVDGMDFKRSFYIIRHRDKHLTKSARAFINLCREQNIEA